jgi:hypothetical protein
LKSHSFPKIRQVPVGSLLPVNPARPRLAVAVLACLAASVTSARNVDAVMEWNRLAMAAVLDANPAQGPVMQLRTMTIVHVAMHDAINAITREYKTYLPAGAAPPGASPVAAAIASAHHTLAALLPSQAAAFAAARASSFRAHGLAEADPGVAFGVVVAAAVLSHAMQDRFSQAQLPYVAPAAGSPGVWVPVGESPPVLAALGSARPWVLTRGSQLRPEPPPPLASARYARDYDEVKTLGAANGARTPMQTGIAQFWLTSSATIWNRVARQVIDARGSSLSGSARALALMYLAAADAAIAGWDAIYTFNVWRPVTAIRQADRDGNDKTLADASWQPIAATSQHPDYPAGYTTTGAAMATILIRLFGDESGVTLIATSPTNPSLTRRWKTFSEGVAEAIDARVFAGLHFRASAKAGADLGRAVADVVFRAALGPDRRP